MSEYIISLLLVVLVSVFTIYPLFLGRRKPGVADSPEANRLEQLYERRDLYYSSIRDIELDRDMGKLNEQDYAELISRYKEKAATITKLISELQSTGENGENGEETNTSLFETPVS
ncbi:MAG: hypothetical protein F4Y78_06070 [Candidatus Dadabacteria bacterium]|nr:hypothetical protein [Candidatus Dadabacteria bacterium]MYA48274.1 hypothetical protein [Candidatus Dadabacteria bacterium]MYF47491.1 hypothetical protein [Candidatus Dadabacteria bacterium]MYG82226.1 hypothetical protein [Candidatus Dadabacteria bacterium]MYK48815.1 hypothetical protein [Candidatus Dadabacteria bacterium]